MIAPFAQRAVDPDGSSNRAGLDSGRGDCGDRDACLLPWSLLFYFCQLMARIILLVFLLVSAAIDAENYFENKWLWN